MGEKSFPKPKTPSDPNHGPNRGCAYIAIMMFAAGVLAVLVPVLVEIA